MADPTRTDQTKLVRNVAFLALILALAALLWAIKANRSANDAIERAREAQTTNQTVPLDNDDAGDESMQSTNSEGDIEPQEPTDTGAPDGTGVNSQNAE